MFSCKMVICYAADKNQDIMRICNKFCIVADKDQTFPNNLKMCGNDPIESTSL